MARRKSLAPWSELVIEGVIDSPIDSELRAEELLTPTVNTGFIDAKGVWKGVLSSDSTFGITQTDASVGNGGEIISPSANADGTWPLDMTGYSNVVLAIKPTNAGNYAITAVMGTGSFANLTPINSGATLRGVIQGRSNSSGDFVTLMSDSAEALTADVWNIFMITSTVSNQKVLQFKIVNNSGDVSTIDTAFMRLV
jgi:hypothetical protein